MLKNILSGVLVWFACISFPAKAQLSQASFNNANSPYDEQNPVLSPDRQSLYFTRAGHPDNISGEGNPGDLWMSKLGENNQWLPPEPVKELNSYGWNGVVDFLDDGRAALLHNHYATGSMLKSQGISISHKTNQGWGKPQNIFIPYFKNTSGYFGGDLSDDGNALVMALETYNTKGSEDIYIALKKGDGWGEMKNLGTAINTRFQELSPTIVGDSILYFASNGHGGKGSMDIFYSKRLDDSWMKWSEPIPLEMINTEGRELSLRDYGGFFLYTSTVDSDGYGDIKLYISGDEDVGLEKQEEDQKVFDIAEVPVDNLPDNTIMVYGVVKEEGTEAIVNGAQIDVEKLGTDETMNVKKNDDFYVANLISPDQYKFTVSAPNYISQQQTVELASSASKKLELNFELKPIEVGTKVNLKNVLFKQSKAEMLESSFDELDLVVDLMKNNPDMKIRLEGHTDNRGVAKHNLRLSKRRVEAVEDYLVSKGIDNKRISGKGYGGTQPIADNEDPMQRMLNRRVEFVIIKN